MKTPRPAPGTPLKLLLVEDSPYMQDVLTERLRGVEGLRLVAVAETAQGALAAVESHQPDIVVLDLVLREGNGLDVLPAFKRRRPPCRVVVFTSYDSEPFRTRCLTAGADHFFSKHRQFRELLKQLQDFGRLPALTSDTGRDNSHL